jgi:hypothetical protein
MNSHQRRIAKRQETSMFKIRVQTMALRYPINTEVVRKDGKHAIVLGYVPGYKGSIDLIVKRRDNHKAQWCVMDLMSEYSEHRMAA